MSHYKPYPKYKASGATDGAKLPQSWKLVKLKYVLDAIESGTSVNANDWPATNGQAGVLKTSCVYTESFRPEENKAVVPEELDRLSCPLRKGSLIVSRMNTPELVGAAGYVNDGAGALYLPDRLWQVSASKALPRFIHYWTQSKHYRDSVKVACTGTSASMQNLSQEQFSDFEFFWPPLEEEERIVSALDRETSRIDALISKKTRFIELLKEKRQALIIRAVTKGLDPNVKMKDSKLAWLGPVPKHWLVAPFRVAVWYQEGPGIMAADFRESGVPLLRISGVQGSAASLSGCNYLDPSKVDEKWSHFRVDLGDVLISASATTGTVSEVGEETVGSVPYTGIIRMKALGAISKDYLKIFLGSRVFHEQIDLFKAGSTIQHYGPTHLSLMRVVLPPISEQEDIARFIERVAKRIGVLIGKTETSIALLRERRSALITAAVTGQIDLRGAA